MKSLTDLTFVCVISFFFLCTSLAFEITKFDVPSQVHRGTSAIFTCEYDLKPYKQLYTLRWLKNNVEFFRFDPALKPQHNFYTIHGLHVNIQKTTGRTLVLDHISKEDAEGTYTCEVTSFPHFARVSKSQRMEVVAHTGEALELKNHEKHSKHARGSSYRVTRPSILAVAFIVTSIVMMQLQ